MYPEKPYMGAGLKHKDEQAYRPPEAYFLTLSHQPMAFLYLGLKTLLEKHLSAQSLAPTMNVMPALEVHANAQRMQSRADYERPIFIPKEITIERVQNAIGKLRPEQQHILQEFFAKLSPEQTADAMTRLNDLAKMAESTFAPMLRTFETTPTSEELQEFEKRFFDWMGLVMPIIGEKTPWVQSVEARTGLTNINSGERIWTSQPVGRYISKQEVQENPALLRDANGWQESSGLLIHTATAAWGIERFVTIIQDNLRLMQADGKTLNERQLNILKLDGKTMRVWLLFHDAMRTFSHDAFAHAAALPLFAELLELPEFLLKDFDLPEIMSFMEEAPEKVNGAGNMPKGLPPFRVEEYLRANPDLLMKNGEFYIENVLTLLKEKQISDTPDEAILFFWIIDAYSKLQPAKQFDSLTGRAAAHESDFAFPSQKAVEQNLDRMLADAREEDEKSRDPGAPPSEYFLNLEKTVGTIRAGLTGLYSNPRFLMSNRQPDDTNQFFVGRFLYRSGQGDANGDRMYRYYSRQNDMAFAVFDWIRAKLNMDKQDLWKFFFEITEANYAMLDPNMKFQYVWADGQTSPFPWKAVKSASEERRENRLAMSHTLTKPQFATATQTTAGLTS